MLADEPVECGLIIFRGSAFRLFKPGVELGLKGVDVPIGPVTAKLCKLAKGARAAEMSLHPTRLWAESTFGKKLEFKTVTRTAPLAGTRD